MDREHLRAAIRLSCEKLEAGEGGPFGAVVACAGEIVGRGWNRVTSTNDPTAHAEIVAIRDACRRRGSFALAGCTLYSSCEPCPMCLAAIYWARLDRVVYAAAAADAAAAGFDDCRFYEELRLPAAARAVPMQQDLREEAQEAFRRWAAKPDRVPY